MYDYVLILLTVPVIVSLANVVDTYQHYRLEEICRPEKVEFPLKNRPSVFIFNSSVKVEQSCHLELEQVSDGIFVFVEVLDIHPRTNHVCDHDYVRFGIDHLFITVKKSNKLCGLIESPSPLFEHSSEDFPKGFQYKTPYSERTFNSENDSEMDIWIKLYPGSFRKTIKLVVTPFKRSCGVDSQYRQCPGSPTCIRNNLFCDGKPNCLFNAEDENFAYCNLSPGGIIESSLGIPIIIIIVVISLVALMFFVFCIQKIVFFIRKGFLGSENSSEDRPPIGLMHQMELNNQRLDRQQSPDQYPETMLLENLDPEDDHSVVDRQASQPPPYSEVALKPPTNPVVAEEDDPPPYSEIEVIKNS